MIYISGWFNAGTRVQNFLFKVAEKTEATIRVVDVEETEVAKIFYPGSLGGVCVDITAC